MGFFVALTMQLAVLLSMFIKEVVWRGLAYQGSELKSERSSVGMVQKSSLNTALEESIVRQRIGGWLRECR